MASSTSPSSPESVARRASTHTSKDIRARVERCMSFRSERGLRYVACGASAAIVAVFATHAVLHASVRTNHGPLMTRHALRVCADPNNLPFSNQKGQGFENALAQLIARDLGDTL